MGLDPAGGLVELEYSASSMTAGRLSILVRPESLTASINFQTAVSTAIGLPENLARAGGPLSLTSAQP